MNLDFPTRSDHFDLIDFLNANFSEIATKTINGDTIYGGTIVSNLNTIAKTGFYTSYGTATGAPSTSYSWFIEHINSNAGTVSAYQRAVAYSTDIIVAERTKIASAWGAWFFNNASTISADLTSINLGDITTHKILKRNGICEYKLDAISGTWTAGVSYQLGVLNTEYRPSIVKLEKQILLFYSGTTPYFAILTIGAISGAISIIPRTNMSSLPLRIDETFLT